MSSGPQVTCTSLAQAAEDLWETAAAALGEDLKSALEPSDGNRGLVLEGVLLEANQKQKQCLEKRWKLKNRKGDVIILRDVFEKIITWVNAFKGVGDIISSMGPSWATIPWTLVSMLLKVVVTDNETFATMVEGLEKATRVISRYSVFEAVYLRNETAGTQQLRTSLVALYASVLTFLGESYRYFAKNTATRFIKALGPALDVDDLLDEIATKQAEVDRDALLVGTETLQSTAADIRGLFAHSTSVTSQLTLLETHLEQMQQTQVVISDFRALRDAISTMVQPVQRVIVQVPFPADNLEVAQRKAMLDWLSSVPYKPQHLSEKHRRLPDSGAWMFGSDEFRRWKDSSVSGTLWLHGMPGCGKTKLLSAAVDHELEEAGKHPRSAPVTYFYCSRNTAEPERSDPVEILRCLARQLCGDDLSKPVPASLRQLYEFFGSPAPGTSNLPLDRTIQLILDLLKENPATIIIDALDECDSGTRHELFEALDEIVAMSENIAKIFLTSRNDGDIVCRLASTPNIYIDAQKNAHDIQRFIVAEVERVINQKQLLRGQVSQALKAQITTTLTDRADGMFRWVTLQIQNLCDARRMRLEKDVRAELGQLPKTLADLYSVAFSQILGLGSESAKLAIKALQILLGAFRPLSWAEFLYLLALSDDGLQLGITKDEVLDVTCNFIEPEAKADRVAFPHLSAREYLETRPEFNKSALHVVASQTCLNGILHTSPPDSGEPAMDFIYYLPDSGAPVMGFTYCPLYLGSHLAKLSATERRKVSLLERFLFGDPAFFARFVRRIRGITSFSQCYPYDESQIPSMVVFLCSDPLSMICLYGLEGLLSRAITHEDDLYQLRSLAPAPLFHLAAAAKRLVKRSCLEFVVLLRHSGLLRETHALGLGMDRYNDSGKTPLHLACSEGLDDMVGLLLAFGADPNRMTARPREARRVALPFRYVNFDVRDALLHPKPHLDPVRHRPASSFGFRPGNAEGLPSPFGVEKELQFPIHLAISLGRSIACVRALVEHGADSNARTSSGATAMQLCFEMGDGSEEIVRFLLSRGADPNAEVSMGRTMLHIAAAMGIARVVALLIASGADPARRDLFGQTPWDNAMRYGHTAVAEALAAAGGRPEQSVHSMLNSYQDYGAEDDDSYYYAAEEQLAVDYGDGSIALVLDGTTASHTGASPSTFTSSEASTTHTSTAQSKTQGRRNIHSAADKVREQWAKLRERLDKNNT